MSLGEDLVWRGRAVEIPECSLGEYLTAKMRAHPRDFVIQVDARTGAAQTASELLATSIRLSEGLKKLGVREGDVVALFCKNSPEADETVLGTWLAGATIACFPCGSTSGDAKHVLKIVRPKLVVCDEEAVDAAAEALKFLSLPSKVVVVGGSKNPHLSFRDVLDADVDVDGYEPQPVKSPSTQLVAILTSSGTSGLPKGVGMTHKSFIYQTKVMESQWAFSQRMDFIQLSQFFWVTGMLTFLASLTMGMKRVLVPDLKAPSALGAIERYKGKTTLMAPSIALSISTSPDFEKFDVSSLKVVILGGSPLTPNIYRILEEKWKGVKFVQCYGTTEICGSITSDGEDPLSVGRVVAGLQIKVVDLTTREPLGPKASGEIMVKTPGLMRGYVNNEEATREAVDEDGWYHTGDLGYYDDSGHFYLVERLKEMIKIMNMQVPPAEVEDPILSIPGVMETCVTGVVRDGKNEEVVALIVKKPNSTLTEQEVFARLSSELSEYKRPTGGIFFVESLPKTPGGKIRRREVRNLAQSLASKQ